MELTAAGHTLDRLGYSVAIRMDRNKQLSSFTLGETGSAKALACTTLKHSKTLQDKGLLANFQALAFPSACLCSLLASKL